ncbi:MAG: hemerythrin domain-containing protein [Roseburia sp.]|nr:hemerythrin domain-containing protein [Roseburia sp.]
MVNEVKWNDRFNLGVANIDKAHQRLFSIVGKLLVLNEDEAKQQHACREGVKYFKSYTIKHFAEEEAYMQSIHYSGYEIHKKLHDNMRDNTIPALEQELEEQNYSIESVRHFLGICVGWLTGHIMIEDCAIAGRTTNKWVHRPSEDELMSLEKAIIQVLHDIFKIDARIISEHYSGEDFSFGKTICYRLTYLAQDGKHFQVFLTYEEQMVLNALGSMLGKQIKRADQTVLYAMRILSQQFMDCVGKHFALTKGCRLDKTDLLTFEQLLRTFDKEYPTYSLLFNTEGKGYFAFCVRK